MGVVRFRYTARVRLAVMVLLLMSSFLLYALKGVDLDFGSVGTNSAAADISAGGTPEFAASWLKEALNQGLPPAPTNNRDDYSSRGLAGRWLTAASEIKDPRGVIAWELSWLPALDRSGPTMAAPASSETLDQVKDDLGEEYYIDEEGALPDDGFSSRVPVVDGLPLVGIYTTHNAEAYVPTYGKAKVEGENAGVYEVARHLREALARFNVASVQSETLHDYPEFNKAYTNSAQTVRSMVKGYPSLKLVLDIHRDSLPSNDPQTTKVGGKDTAKILFIVGTDERTSHPNWRTNLELAETIAQNLESKYPGLCRGIRTKPGTYNQHLHPGGLLIEVGNANNSLEEAQRAADCLAEAISLSLQL